MAPQGSKIASVVDEYLRSILDPEGTDLATFGHTYQDFIPVGTKSRWVCGFYFLHNDESLITPGMMKWRQAGDCILARIRLLQAAPQQHPAQPPQHQVHAPAAAAAAAAAVAHMPQQMMHGNLQNPPQHAAALHPQQVQLPQLQHLSVIQHAADVGEDVEGSGGESDDHTDGTLLNCCSCLDPVHSSKAFILECGHIFDKECITEYICDTPSERLPQCVACVAGKVKTPLSYYDIMRVVGMPKLRIMLGKLERCMSTQVFTRKRLHCSNPSCVGSPIQFTPLFADFQMFMCRCGSSICAICEKPLEAHVLPNTPKCQPLPISPDLIALNAKPCPECYTIAAFREGCNTVVCSTCGETFCWMCGMNLSDGWRCEDKSATELSERAIYHHLHFTTDMDYLKTCMDFFYDKPCLNRACCQGMQNGDIETETAFKKLNGHGPFGLGNPGVKRMK